METPTVPESLQELVYFDDAGVLRWKRRIPPGEPLYLQLADHYWLLQHASEDPDHGMLPGSVRRAAATLADPSGIG